LPDLGSAGAVHWRGADLDAFELRTQLQHGLCKHSLCPTHVRTGSDGHPAAGGQQQLRHRPASDVRRVGGAGNVHRRDAAVYAYELRTQLQPILRRDGPAAAHGRAGLHPDANRHPAATGHKQLRH